MNIYEELINKKDKLSVIGLGYVGIPLAVAFDKRIDVIGFDIDKEKINLFKKGLDITKEVGDKKIYDSNIYFTSNEEKLKNAKFHIVAVPTPISEDKTPNLEPLIKASEIVGNNLKEGSFVVYESTVYPGVTEEVCIPVLEKRSNLKCSKDFKVGYSPERINPGDKIHSLENIKKVVSSVDSKSLDILANVYKLIIKKGVYKAESIKIAEAAKIIENSQRDINIAFMNELSIIFNKLNIDNKKVLKAAKTKWNFLNFEPGLVGGHCIGVDPYYLTYKCEKEGYHSKIILAGRQINDYMAKYVAENTVKNLIKANTSMKKFKVAIMGLTFKKNCPDIRNTKVLDIIKELKEYNIEILVTDPIADKNEVYKEYNIKLLDFEDISGIDALIIAVKHDTFKSINLEDIKDKFNESKVLIDVKGLFDRFEALNRGFIYWGL
ncbi:MAG: nucleotide sugar dehydrogenase [Firmicutes bacterium]|nr:nucleotide sugar dehydrogenase [Bacillota bacterium]